MANFKLIMLPNPIVVSDEKPINGTPVWGGGNIKHELIVMSWILFPVIYLPIFGIRWIYNIIVHKKRI